MSPQDRVVQLLEQQLQSPELRVRRNALIALASIAEPRSLAVLVAVARDGKDPRLREQALAELDGLPHEHRPEIIQCIRRGLDAPATAAGSYELLDRLRLADWSDTRPNRSLARRWRLAWHHSGATAKVRWGAAYWVFGFTLLGAVLGAVAVPNDLGRYLPVVVSIAMGMTLLVLLTTHRAVAEGQRPDPAVGTAVEACSAALLVSFWWALLGLGAAFAAVNRFEGVDWTLGLVSVLVATATAAAVVVVVRYGGRVALGISHGLTARVWQTLVGAASGWLVIALVIVALQSRSMIHSGVLFAFWLLVPPWAFACSAAFARIEDHHSSEAQGARPWVVGSIVLVASGLLLAQGHLPIPGVVTTDAKTPSRFDIPIDRLPQTVDFEVRFEQRVSLNMPQDRRDVVLLLYRGTSLIERVDDPAEIDRWLRPGSYSLVVYAYSGIQPKLGGVGTSLLELLRKIYHREDTDAKYGELTLELNKTPIVDTLPSNLEIGIPTAVVLRRDASTLDVVVETEEWATLSARVVRDLERKGSSEGLIAMGLSAEADAPGEVATEVRDQIPGLLAPGEPRRLVVRRLEPTPTEPSASAAMGSPLSEEPLLVEVILTAVSLELVDEVPSDPVGGQPTVVVLRSDTDEVLDRLVCVEQWTNLSARVLRGLGPGTRDDMVLELFRTGEEAPDQPRAQADSSGKLTLLMEPLEAQRLIVRRPDGDLASTGTSFSEGPVLVEVGLELAQGMEDIVSVPTGAPEASFEWPINRTPGDRLLRLPAGSWTVTAKILPGRHPWAPSEDPPPSPLVDYVLQMFDVENGERIDYGDDPPELAARVEEGVYQLTVRSYRGHQGLVAEGSSLSVEVVRFEPR